MYSVTGNRSFKQSPNLICCFYSLERNRNRIPLISFGVWVFQRTFVHIRKASGSLTTQLKTDGKVDGARSGAESIFNLDQQLTFSRTILLQAFPQHIGMSRTCIQFQDCIEIVFDTATRLRFHKDPRNLAH